jgi:hypothetical protein
LIPDPGDERKPTLDERLAALTHSLELLAQMRNDGEKTWELRWAASEKRFSQITHNFEIVHDSIKRLENIALPHQQRIDDIESSQQ